MTWVLGTFANGAFCSIVDAWNAFLWVDAGYGLNHDMNNGDQQKGLLASSAKNRHFWQIAEKSPYTTTTWSCILLQIPQILPSNDLDGRKEELLVGKKCWCSILYYNFGWSEASSVTTTILCVVFVVIRNSNFVYPSGQVNFMSPKSWRKFAFSDIS
jgi:hypothetical protein